MFCAGRFTLSQSSPPVRNAKFIDVFREILSTSMFFLLLDLLSEGPTLAWGMQRICGPFGFQTVSMPFRRLFVLWHSPIKDRYFYTSYTFRPILARFSYTLVYTNFFLTYITTQNIFPIPDDAVARNLIIILNFSSQRPHLNYIFLCNVYSFDTMEFSMKHKC